MFDRRRRVAVLATLVGLLSGCGSDQTTPDASPSQDVEPASSPTPADVASTPVASPTATEEPVVIGDYELTFDPGSIPCDVVDEAAVAEILGTSTFNTYDITYGDEYPEEFNASGLTAGSHVCYHATGSSGDGSIVRVNLGPGGPIDNLVSQYRDNPGCEVIEGTALGEDGVRISCDHPDGEGDWQAEAGHIALLGDAVFQCVAGLESGDVARLAPAMDDFCTSVVEQLAPA